MTDPAILSFGDGVRLVRANILTAFNESTVGSKVTDPALFLSEVRDAVGSFDFTAANPKVRTPGQGYIVLDGRAKSLVSGGVGKHVDDPTAYVLRSWRGSVGHYLKRKHAAPVDSVAVVVYTADAYLSDPDVAGDATEVARVKAMDATHVLVAVLASSGPPSPLSPGRLVSNLAGGNKDALAWTADEIRAKAKESSDYANAWGVVAD